MAQCTNGHQMADGKKFCGACGSPVVATSPTSPGAAGPACRAGHPNRVGAKFCRVCGASMTGAEQAPPPPIPAGAPTSAMQSVMAPRAGTPSKEVPAPPATPSPAPRLRTYEDEVLPPEEQTTRNLVVLLLDNSGSMTEAGASPTRTRLAELNDALRSFTANSMHEVPQLEMNGELAIGTFAYDRMDWLSLDGRSVSQGSPFHYARYMKAFHPIEPTNGTTPMDIAVRAGLTLIEERKRALAASGYVHESRPVMFLLTDGESSNDMTDALRELRQAEASKKVLFFALGVGNASDEAMRQIAPHSYYSLKDQPIEACLRFVSGSLGVLSGLDDTAEAMYSAVRNANTRENRSAEDFLRGS